MSTRERAEQTVADTLRSALQYVSAWVQPKQEIASDVLGDLASAGFTVVESWQLNRDVLAAGFRQAEVIEESYSPSAWDVPTDREADRMADVVRRMLGEGS